MGQRLAILIVSLGDHLVTSRGKPHERALYLALGSLFPVAVVSLTLLRRFVPSTARVLTSLQLVLALFCVYEAVAFLVVTERCAILPLAAVQLVLSWTRSRYLRRTPAR